MKKHTPGPWGINETKVRNGYELLVGANMQKICAVYGSTTPLWDSVPGITTGRANARLIASAPDLLDQVLALTVYGWEVEKVSMYDEEGVEGWCWHDHNGKEHYESGAWDEPPPWPDSAREALAKQRGMKA